MVVALLMTLLPAALAESAEKITLSVFDAHAYGLDEYAQMVANFEAANPDIKIEVQHAANDSTTLLNARINSGDVPDVFDVQVGSQAQSYYEYAYDWSNDADVISLFHDDAIKTGMNAEGKVMSLPWTYENMTLIYNKDLFAKAGIAELPKTMTELEAACEKLKAAGITPFAIAAKESWVLNHVSTHFMMVKDLDAAGTIQALKDGTYTFQTLPNFQNFFKFLDLAVKYGPEKPLEIDWETCENMLVNGQAAMIHMGDWCQATLDKFNPDAKVGFMPFPVSEKAEDVNLLSNISWTYIVNKDSKHLDAAKKYLQYILTSEDGVKWATQTIGAASGAKTDLTVNGELANDAATYIAKGETNAWIHTLTPTGWGDNVGPLYQAYMLGQMSADDVCQQMQDFFAY
jgi:raffinose/stachyose/melibiose transport system substrate-binding protein